MEILPPETTTDEACNEIKFLKKKNKTFTFRSKQETSDQEQDEDPTANSNQDSTPTIEELIAIRKLKQNKVGIDLNKLNAGEPKKKKKKRNPHDGSEVKDDSNTGMQKTTDGEEDDIKKDDRLGEDDPEDEDARTRKIIKSNHFTQQTNTLDVDKHMMTYIEEELQRRRQEAIAAGTAEESTEPILKGMDAIASLDPRDELYMIAEKYRITKKPVVEGNVTLSATMLTSIPEVDLGIDNRIRNFEATEKAKRLLTEQRPHSNPNHINVGQSTNGKNKNKTTETTAENGTNNTVTSTNYMIDTKEHFAADRFLLPNHLKQQHSISSNIVELDSLKIAKLEKEGLFDQAEALRKEIKKKAYQLKYGNNNNNNNNHHHQSNHRFHGHRSNQLATDDRAVENFRKRMAGRR